MEILLLAAAGATGASTLIAFLKTRKTRHIIRYKKPTQAEILIEQKELARWLIQEASSMNAKGSATKEQAGEMLFKLDTFYRTANLTSFSKMKISDCINGAQTALQVVDAIDRRYLYLLNILVEGTVTAVLRIAGSDENVRQFLHTRDSLKGITTGFQNLIGGVSEIPQWKHDALNRNNKR